MLAECIPCGAGEQTSRVSKMPKENPAEGLGEWTVQSLLSITELPETQLGYQEMTARTQWACVESFFIFALWHNIVQLFLFKMLGPSLQFNKTWGFELKKLQWELTKMMNLRQIHLKAVINAVPGVKEVTSTPLPAPSLVACFYPFNSSSVVPATYQVPSPIPEPKTITVK